MSQLFLLSRSVAFLILVALPTVYLWLGMGLDVAAARRRRGRTRIRKPSRFGRAIGIVGFAALAISLVEVGRSAGPTDSADRFFSFLLASVISAGVFVILLAPLINRAPTRLRFQLIGGIAAVCALVGTGVALMDEATEAARAVRQGREMRPVMMLGLPLLDVESQTVRINWIIPAAQRPADVLKDATGSCALLVGKSETTIFVIPKGTGQVAQLPIASIALRQDPSCSS